MVVFFYHAVCTETSLRLFQQNCPFSLKGNLFVYLKLLTAWQSGILFSHPEGGFFIMGFLRSFVSAAKVLHAEDMNVVLSPRVLQGTVLTSYIILPNPLLSLE